VLELISLYKILFIVLAILAISFVLGIYKNGKISMKVIILWIFLWFILIIFSLIPDLTTFLANYLGIGRGIDLLFIVGILGAYYLLFRLYLNIENINQDINKLVTEIAIFNENREEDEK
jgi:hypothetical protein